MAETITDGDGGRDDQTMMALVFDADGKTNALVRVPVPKELGPTQVLVRVAYVGVCGTDLHAMKVTSRVMSYLALYFPFHLLFYSAYFFFPF